MKAMKDMTKKIRSKGRKDAESRWWDAELLTSDQQKVRQMIKSAEGSARLLHKITKPTAWRGGAQILKKEEEDARLLLMPISPWV